MSFADTNGQHLYYEDTGWDGPAVIFSHGFLMDHDMFAPQVDALRDRYRVITWDERGHGQTPCEGPFDYWDSARDLLALQMCIRDRHKGVRVPEHVAAVAGTGQAPSADGRLPSVSDRSHQMKEREADAQLQLVVSLDDHVGVLPPTRPRMAVLGQEAVEADFGRLTEGLDGREGVGKGLRVATVDGDAIKHPVPRVGTVHRAAPGQSGLGSRRHDPAVGTSDPDPCGVADPTSIVGEVICRGTEGRPAAESGGIPDSEGGCRWPGLGHEPHALDQVCLRADTFVDDPGPQIDGPLQRHLSGFLAERKRNGPGEQVGGGTVPRVDASGDNPRAPARVDSEGRAARPDVSVSKGEKCFVNVLVLGVVTLPVSYTHLVDELNHRLVHQVREQQRHAGTAQILICAYLFDGVEPETSSEDAQSREQLLLIRSEKVVRPLH